MKQITIITDFKFWERDSGSKNRTYNLIKRLDTFFKMNIIYLDDVKSETLMLINALGLQSNFIALNSMASSKKNLSVIDEPELKDFTNITLIKELNNFLIEHHTDIIINTNIRTHVYMQNLPYEVTSILDLHDLMHLRFSSFQAHALRSAIEISEKREFEILQLYDYVLAIQENECQVCMKHMDSSKVLLVPHAITVERLYRSKNSVNAVGFIATDNLANLKSIEWFLTHVWIFHNCFPSLVLNVYGTITKRFITRNLPFVNLIGTVQELKEVYKENDIMISPIQLGSGLKIKNVEALAYGLPMITTSIGAEGMLEGADDAYLLADTPNEWCKALSALSISMKLRDSLSVNALSFAQKMFSVEACYDDFVQLLKRR